MEPNQQAVLAASIQTPDAVIEHIKSTWDENTNRVSAMAYADAVYKIQVAHYLLQLLNIK